MFIYIYIYIYVFQEGAPEADVAHGMVRPLPVDQTTINLNVNNIIYLSLVGFHPPSSFIRYIHIMHYILYKYLFVCLYI